MNGHVKRSAVRIVVLTSVHAVDDKRVFRRHARFLAQLGCDVHLVALSSASRTTVVDGVTIHEIRGTRTWVGRVRAHGTLVSAVRALSPDVVHFHDPDLLLAIPKLRRAVSAAIIYDAHEDFALATVSSRGFAVGVSQLAGLVVDAVERFFSRFADGVVCAHRQRLEEIGRVGARLFYPNYPDPEFVDEARAAMVPLARRSGCVYLGLLTEQRGSALLVDIAALLPRCMFTIAGPFASASAQRDFEELVARRGVQNVRYLGSRPYSEVPRLMGAARVGIMPWLATPQHLRAAQPTKLYEYIAGGLPVVATRLPITDEVIAAHSAGLLHDPGDARAAAASIELLLADDEVWRQCSAKALAAYDASYSFAKISGGLLRLYSTALKSRGKPEVAAECLRLEESFG